MLLACRVYHPGQSDIGNCVVGLVASSDQSVVAIKPNLFQRLGLLLPL
jgi:hypothetical protein